MHRPNRMRDRKRGEFARVLFRVDSLERRVLLSGTISGAIWTDLNSTNLNYEKYLYGWTVYVDDNGNGQFDEAERSTITAPPPPPNIAPTFKFTDLPAGTHRIGIISPPGWHAVPAQEVTIADGQTASVTFHVPPSDRILHNNAIEPQFAVGPGGKP